MPNKDPIKRAEYQRQYRLKNIEKFREYDKSERRKQKKMEWKEENHDKILSYYRKSHEKNREKRNAHSREYSKSYDANRAKTPERKAQLLLNRLVRRYGITIEELEIIKNEQKNKCIICNKELDWKGKQAHIDHCHKTGIVRGILCRTCNLGIGHLKDNADFARAAANYLSETSK